MSNNLRSEESGNSELHTGGEPLDSTKQENYICKPAQNLNTAEGNLERLLKGSQKHTQARPEFQPTRHTAKSYDPIQKYRRQVRSLNITASGDHGL